jgi:hypothetical protein
MLVVTGIFDNERFIPDRPVSIPQKKKVTITIDDTETEHTAEAMPKFTMEQMKEWSQSPDIQCLVGVLKDAGLPENLTAKDIHRTRLEERYKEYLT